MDYKVSKKMEFNILQEITDGFSTEIGRGAFGVVYKVCLSCHNSLSYEVNNLVDFLTPGHISFFDETPRHISVF